MLDKDMRSLCIRIGKAGDECGAIIEELLATKWYNIPKKLKLRKRMFIVNREMKKLEAEIDAIVEREE